MNVNYKSNLYVPKLSKLCALGKSVESWIKTPGAVHVYWKDMHGFYLGCNDLVADKINIRCRQDIVGKTDYDFVSRAQAPVYINEDYQAFNTGHPKQFYGYGIFKASVITWLTTKMPLVDSTQRTIGTFGMSFYLTEKPFSAFQKEEELQQYIANIENQATNYHQDYSIPKKMLLNGVTLSSRESEVIYYLAKGLSIKQIARRLLISPRTVETHLDHLKNKLGRHYKTELIEMLFNAGIF